MATYKIKSGDTLSQIAKKNNTPVRTMQKITTIVDPNKIRAGKTLNLGIGKPGLSSARKMTPYAGQTKTEMKKMSMKKPTGSKSKTMMAKPKARPSTIGKKKLTGTAARKQRRMTRRA